MFFLIVPKTLKATSQDSKREARKVEFWNFQPNRKEATRRVDFCVVINVDFDSTITPKLYLEPIKETLIPKIKIKIQSFPSYNALATNPRLVVN